MDSYLEMAEATANPDQALDIYQQLISEKNPLELTPTQIKALVRVLGNSNFLARWCRKNPDAALEVLSGDWEQPWSLTQYEAALSKPYFHDPSLSMDEQAGRLINFKYRHFFRNTLQDFGEIQPFHILARDLSDLARTIVGCSLKIIYQHLEDSLGSTQEENNTSYAIPFTVLGMGKLGGLELNYSSDIDIVYFYGTDKGKVIKDGKDSGTSPHEYFIRLSKKLTNFINNRRPEGFLYRVDLELRPEGNSGTLANSLQAMENYYEFFGAHWEKQALIKANWVAGSTDLIDKLLDILFPFVFPKSADFGFLKKMKDMKEKLFASTQNTSQKGVNIKLGKGGIREIEFFVQSLQTLFGGNNPSLQASNTLNAITQLQHAKLISPAEKQKLQEAYVFLRTLENRLQQVEEQQIHTLPDDPHEWELMALRMGYHPKIKGSSEELIMDLNKHQNFVETTFNSLFANRFEEYR